ncbi:DUF3139 domain-containing protein [Bacillus sp. BRMEA1]|uniref:DUF3139 domain-containing protein n=1 Tax=Neobacillus endophyticus TaxID=2738405 RepID=UPI001563E2CA|nr:DUF3139 domain-containing protein [Neobacillus endophyticus]NRD80980.1 DUF3139 domain-containing protein [Neobacillus endophyticus]
MRNIFVKTIAIIFSLLIIIPLGLYGYISYQLHSLKNDTYEYLSKKYDKSQIQKIETNLTIASYHYSAFVTFKDEPEHIYEYIRVDGKIRQGSPFPNEKEAPKYKYLEPNKD